MSDLEGAIIDDSSASQLPKKDYLAIMRSAQGLWKSRFDLSDFSRLRKELDRKNGSKKSDYS